MKMHSSTAFGSLALGTKFKATKHSFLVFTKVSPSMDPRQHNAVSVNVSQTLYDWFDHAETVHVQR